MNIRNFAISSVTCASLFFQSCASLNDDAFAHAVKSGNRSETMRLMQPHSGRLQIQEQNGQWYNPLQYAIASGDSRASFALLERGAPDSFDGKSLAYNAASANQPGLATQFANAGYGSMGDIEQAAADARAAEEQKNNQNMAMLAIGCVIIAAMLGGGGGGGDYDSGEADREARRKQQAQKEEQEAQRNRDIGAALYDQRQNQMRDNRAAAARGDDLPYPIVGTH